MTLHWESEPLCIGCGASKGRYRKFCSRDCADNSRGHDVTLITRMRRLWKQGYSISEIGRRVGVTRNVVVGIAHRHDGFSERPSPLIGKGLCDPDVTKRRKSVVAEYNREPRFAADIAAKLRLSLRIVQLDIRWSRQHGLDVAPLPAELRTEMANRAWETKRQRSIEMHMR